MREGQEFKSEWGETVIVLRASEILDVVYFTDELMFVDSLPIGAFVDNYKPTGRVNTALKTLFDETNFERIERLQEEVKEIQSDIKDIFAEAKAVGYDVKIMREMIKLRKMNAVDRDEQEYLIDTYKRALGL